MFFFCLVKNKNVSTKTNTNLLPVLARTDEALNLDIPVDDASGGSMGHCFGVLARRFDESSERKVKRWSLVANALTNTGFLVV